MAAGVAAVAVASVLWMLRPQPVMELPRDQLVLQATPQGEALCLAANPEVIFTGWMTESYPGGGKKSRSRVVDGRLHGLSEGWHPEGGLAVQEHFQAGVAEGPVTKWHSNGAKRSEGAAHVGKLEGVFRRWHGNGVLSEEITMRGGQPHGTARSWDESGNLKKEVMMEGGQLVRRAEMKDSR